MRQGSHSLLLTFVLLLSCTSHQTDKVEDHKEQAVSENVPVSNPLSEDPVYPDWLPQLYKNYVDEIWADSIPEILYYHQINDSTSYCLFNVKSGICGRIVLATQKLRKKCEDTLVHFQCDADFSSPAYSWSDYLHDSLNHTVVTTEFTKKARPEYLSKEDPGRFKEGYDFESAKTTTDSVKEMITIQASGHLTVRRVQPKLKN